MNKEKEFDNQPIPYILYESEMARHERAIKRLVIAIIVVISMLFASNLAWLYAWNSYDYVGTETTTEYTQDGEGINIIGDSNEVADESADGVCYEPLAEEFDLSVRQIKNIVYKAQNKLFKHL